MRKTWLAMLQLIPLLWKPNKNKYFERLAQIKNILIGVVLLTIMTDARLDTQSFVQSIFSNI